MLPLVRPAAPLGPPGAAPLAADRPSGGQPAAGPPVVPAPRAPRAGQSRPADHAGAAPEAGEPGAGGAGPAAPTRLPALDALRAVGAAAVIGTHVGFATGRISDPTWGGLLARLDVGVSIFFVLSGFLLFRPYALAVATNGDRPGAGRYLWRRALRIMPAYWATVVVCLLVIPDNDDASVADWVRHAALAQIYEPNTLRQGLGHTWSLATDEGLAGGQAFEQ